MPYDFPDLSPFDLLAGMAGPDAPTLLDIRLAEDVAEDPVRLPGAIPVAYDDTDQQAGLASVHGAVVICHKGLKLSAGVTARLRGRGVPAWRLQGGHMAWTDTRLPTMASDPPALLVLSLTASPDAVLRTWANLRFLAPHAELLEVPPSDVAGVMDRFDAIAADAPPLPVPGLPLMDRVLPALALALRAGPPSNSFTMLDQAYQGALLAAMTDVRGAA